MMHQTPLEHAGRARPSRPRNAFRALLPVDYPRAATTIAAQPLGAGSLRLMREGWGHYAILLDTGAAVEIIGEADTALLAESLYQHVLHARSASSMPGRRAN